MPVTTAKKRGPSYSHDEVTTLLGVIRQHLPIGLEEWEAVLREHIETWPESGRDTTSIRRKFNQLANKKVPTGDPRCPPQVKEAKRILYLIKQKADVEDFDSEDEEEEEEDDCDDEEQEEEEESEDQKDEDGKQDNQGSSNDDDEDRVPIKQLTYDTSSSTKSSPPSVATKHLSKPTPTLSPKLC